MGRVEPRELESRLVVLLAHLLKWTYQPRGQAAGALQSKSGLRRANYLMTAQL